MQSVLARVIKKLGGRKHNQRLIPLQWPSGLTDFEAHLQVLLALLVGRLDGELENAAFNRIKDHYKRNPENALYSYAYHKYEDGNQSKTYNILMSEFWWPNDRLPTTADRCHEWLLLPEFTPNNIAPCEPFETHSGGDYLFISSLLEEDRG
jgi:hypothetical protein